MISNYYLEYQWKKQKMKQKAKLFLFKGVTISRRQFKLVGGGGGGGGCIPERTNSGLAASRPWAKLVYKRITSTPDTLLAANETEVENDFE